MATLPLIFFLSPDDAPDPAVAQAVAAMGIRPRLTALLIFALLCDRHFAPHIDRTPLLGPMR
jgi:hypothetical protein